MKPIVLCTGALLVVLLVSVSPSQESKPSLSIAGQSLYLGMDKQGALKGLASQCKILDMRNGVIVLDKENSSQTARCNGDVVFFLDGNVSGVSRDEDSSPEAYKSALVLYRLLAEITQGQGRVATVRTHTLEDFQQYEKNHSPYLREWKRSHDPCS